MPEIGAGDSIFLQQNATLYAALQGTDTTADDQFLQMKLTEFTKLHPMTRFDHGLQPGYGFAAPDVTIKARLSGSSDLLSKVNAVATRNKVGVIPERLWRFSLRDNTGSSGDPAAEIQHLDMTCQVYEFSVIKADSHPGDPINVDITMIAKHRIHPTSDANDIDRAVAVTGGT